MSIDQVDGDGTPSMTMAMMGSFRLAEHLGLRPTWVDGTNSGGSAFELLVERAVDAIGSGRAETVLITYGASPRSAKVSIGTAGRGGNLATGPDQWELPFGNVLVGAYAMAARRHMHEFGTPSEQLAQIAVSTRAMAANNPKALYRDPITVDDVLAAPTIADPLHMLDCCVITDGGGAIVLTSEERARDLPSQPVYVVGAA